MEKGTYSDYKCYCCKPKGLNMSVSYPYFTVAKQHNVPYEKVLALIEDYNKNGCQHPPFTDWRVDAYIAWKKEQNRRKET